MVTVTAAVKVLSASPPRGPGDRWPAFLQEPERGLICPPPSRAAEGRTGGRGRQELRAGGGLAPQTDRPEFPFVPSRWQGWRWVSGQGWGRRSQAQASGTRSCWGSGVPLRPWCEPVPDTGSTSECVQNPFNALSGTDGSIPEPEEAQLRGRPSKDPGRGAVLPGLGGRGRLGARQGHRVDRRCG